jgi:hypothetical protein
MAEWQSGFRRMQCDHKPTMWRNYLALRWFFSGEQLSRFQGGHKANANGISTQVFTASGVERNRRRSNRAEVRSLEASADLLFVDPWVTKDCL